MDITTRKMIAKLVVSELCRKTDNIIFEDAENEGLLTSKERNQIFEEIQKIGEKLNEQVFIKLGEEQRNFCSINEIIEYIKYE